MNTGLIFNHIIGTFKLQLDIVRVLTTIQGDHNHHHTIS
jgi:hypothetical protein